MNDDTFLRLKSFVTVFHAAVEQFDFANSGLNLANFPVECCHHACKLLGLFLFEQGIKEIQMISGDRPDDPDGQHLWLEVDGAVVDITAYQFAGVTEKVIVARDSTWHSTLEGKPDAFASENEAIDSYFLRIKKFYNDRFDQLYDRLNVLAQRLLSQQSSHVP